MSISNLQNRLYQLQAEEKRLKARQSGVQDIVKRFGRRPVDNLDDAVFAALNVAGFLYEGTAGSRRIRTLADSIAQKGRRKLDLDDWQDVEYLNREVARLESEISSVQNEIKRVKAQIDEAKRAALVNL